MMRPIKAGVSILVPCLLLLALCVQFSDSVIDDAYIFFRYADNIRAGLGPVFNAGERVEGFTSPLWLVLLTVGGSLGVSYESSVLVLGVFFALATLIATSQIASRLLPPFAALSATSIVALHPGFAMWAVHGLETSLFVMLVTWGMWTWMRRSYTATGLVLGLAFWTRPEAPLLVIVLAGASLARRQSRGVLKLLQIFFLFALPLVLARLAYYGEWFPNTYYAKSGGGVEQLRFGLFEARRFISAHAVLVLGCIGATLLTAVRIRRELSGSGKREVPAVLVDFIVVGVVWSVWVVWSGGDGFPGFRFWLPVLPLAAVVSVWGVVEILRESSMHTSVRPGFTTEVAALILWIAATSVGALPEARQEYESGRAFTFKMTQVGKWLERHAPPDLTLAVNYVGALPYHASLKTIDMLGLTDAVIARTPIEGRFRFPGHAKGNGAYVLDRRPDGIFMNGVHLSEEPMQQLSPELTTEEQIAADPRFEEWYRPVNIRISGINGPLWLGFYLLRDSTWRPETSS